MAWDPKVGETRPVYTGAPPVNTERGRVDGKQKAPRPTRRLFHNIPARQERCGGGGGFLNRVRVTQPAGQSPGLGLPFAAPPQDPARGEARPGPLAAGKPGRPRRSEAGAAPDLARAERRAAARRNLGLGGRRRSGARVAMATARSRGSFWAVPPPRPLGRAPRGIRELSPRPRGCRCWGPVPGGSQGAGTAGGVARVSLGPARGTPPRAPDPHCRDQDDVRPQFLQVGAGGLGSGHARSDGPSQPPRPGLSLLAGPGLTALS